MKKTIILSKGGLDAIATARNIIMELYSTLNKMAARLSMNFAAGADWQCLQKGALMLSPLRCCGKALDLSVCLAGNSQAQIKRGIDTIAAPRGFPKT